MMVTDLIGRKTCHVYSFCDPGIPLPPSGVGTGELPICYLRFKWEQLVLMGILSFSNHSAITLCSQEVPILMGRQ